MRVSSFFLLAAVIANASDPKTAEDTPMPPANSDESVPHPDTDFSKHASHLKPIGDDRATNPITELAAWPAPADFVKSLDEEQPFVVKGGANVFTAAKKWTKSFFSGLEQYVSYVDRYVEGKKPASSAPGLKFTDAIKKVEAEKGSVVTSLYHGLLEDLGVPPPLACADHIQKVELVVTASDGAAHHYENDNLDTFYCLFVGSQNLVLVNHSWGLDFNGTAEGEAIDLNKVDLIKFPGLADSTVSKISLQAGDCVYVPIHWHSWKLTSGKPGVHIGANFMFKHSDIYRKLPTDTIDHCATLVNVTLPQRLVDIDDHEEHFTRFADCLFANPPPPMKEAPLGAVGEELETSIARTEVTFTQAGECVTMLFTEDNLTMSELAGLATLDADGDQKISQVEWNTAVQPDSNDTTIMLSLADVSGFFNGLRGRIFDTMMHDHDSEDPSEEFNSQEEGTGEDKEAEQYDEKYDGKYEGDTVEEGAGGDGDKDEGGDEGPTVEEEEPVPLEEFAESHKEL